MICPEFGRDSHREDATHFFSLSQVLNMSPLVRLTPLFRDPRTARSAYHSVRVNAIFFDFYCTRCVDPCRYSMRLSVSMFYIDCSNIYCVKIFYNLNDSFYLIRLKSIIFKAKRYDSIKLFVIMEFYM